jgi:hypothetical protein
MPNTNACPHQGDKPSMVDGQVKLDLLLNFNTEQVTKNFDPAPANHNSGH